MNLPTGMFGLFTLVLLVFPASSYAGECPCDGDVNDDGVVNIIDGVCIAECRGGDCSCCVSSCDVNCDGVVDALDAGDDIINDDSAWLCLFEGRSPDVCCAPRGACCDDATGICTDDVASVDCSGAGLSWFEEVSCTAVACPAGPAGACCHTANGHCRDGVVEFQCTGADEVWTGSTTCASVSCSTSPPDPCPCHADVNNDGVVDAVDGACIEDCKAGDCACCVWSCDVNCDGVVDDGDVGNDVLNDDSSWLCRFQGAGPEVCCPALGACCDDGTGLCTDGVASLDCSGAGLTWSEGLACSAVPCPSGPRGACCHTGNGQCADEVPEFQCTGPDQVWTASMACASVSCSTSPPDPCPCDGDVDDNGAVDIIDGVCITECRGGDCSCCTSSCDVNCDGVVDALDAGDDIVNDDSAWLCLFEGRSPDVCCPAIGACCDESTGVCTDDVAWFDCSAADLSWSEGLSCGQVSCTAPAMGACCDTSRGLCEEQVLEADCARVDDVWSEGLSCAAVSCPTPPDGACCHTGNGQCQDGVLEVDCTDSDRVWSETVACADVACSTSPPDPCPCDGDVDDNGRVDLVDGVCILDCRVGDCSCCVSSCDVNCDGVVDALDAGDDIVNDDSTWLCLFEGRGVEYCCSSGYQEGIRLANGIPAIGTWGLLILGLLVMAGATVILHQRRGSAFDADP